MLIRVKNYIHENKLIQEGDRIVLGVSGGADSVCLLHILNEIYKEFRAELVVVHVNHGIRGRDAQLDEEFVSGLCERLGLEYQGYHYDVKSYAKKKGLSEEEAGRQLRYQAFLEVCQRYGCNKIAIAHNKNDNAETFLFHLFRGTRIKGLTGINSCRELQIEEASSEKVMVIRPLLQVSREDIENYLDQNGMSYRTDLTNLSEDYSRNKIRNRILSYAVKEINKNVIGHITSAAESLAEIESFLDRIILEKYALLVKKEELIYHFSIKELKKEDMVIQKGVIYRLLECAAGQRKDLEAKHVEMIIGLFDKQVGKILNLPYGIRAIRQYEEINLYPTGVKLKIEYETDDIQEVITVVVPGRTYLGQDHKFLETKIIEFDGEKEIPKNSCTKWLDYDKIENAVELRTRREGDYLQINPLGGRKKIKDYFIDIKLPREERSKKLLLTDGRHVMWILGDGGRISEKYKVSDSTKNILLINLIDAEEKENDR